MSDTPRTAATSNDIRLGTLPRGGWPKRVADTLARLRVETWGDLEHCSAAVLLSNHGFSQRGLSFVRGRLAEQGLCLAGTQPPDVALSVRPPSSQPITGVYFVRCGQFIKIGFASNVRKRLSEIATSIPFDIVLIGIEACGSRHAAKERERALHRQFHDLRRRGEWFQRQSPLIEFLDSLRHQTL